MSFVEILEFFLAVIFLTARALTSQAKVALFEGVRKN